MNSQPNPLNAAESAVASDDALSQMDRAATLHPFTPLRAFEADETGGPRIVERGDGIRITDAEGKTSIDGFAGLYCVEVIFLNAAGVDEGGRNFVGPAAPYIPTATWTTHSGTVIAGTAVNGSQWDVSGGVTLELKVACGAVVGGCGVARQAG